MIILKGFSKTIRNNSNDTRNLVKTYSNNVQLIIYLGGSYSYPPDIIDDINLYKKVTIGFWEKTDNFCNVVISDEKFKELGLDKLKLSVAAYANSYLVFEICSFQLEQVINILENSCSTPIKSALLNNLRQEKPCKFCSKPNDFNVSLCWWCGVSNSTT